MIVPLRLAAGDVPAMITVDYQDHGLAAASVQAQVQATADWLMTPGAANDGALPAQAGVANRVIADAQSTITLTGGQS